MQILNVETGEIRKLANHEKFESFGLFSPDGSQVAYRYPRDGDYNNVNEIFVTSVAGGDGVDLTREIDRHLQLAIWMPDGPCIGYGPARRIVGSPPCLMVEHQARSRVRFHLAASIPEPNAE